jgi:branched-chain amino acid transport system permease protein
VRGGHIAPRAGSAMSLSLLVQALLNGFGLAMAYVLVALGLTLIFSILEIINFAHGEFYMVGGFVTYLAFGVWGLPYVVALLAAIFCVAAAGVVAERLVFRHLRGKTLNAFIVSLGLLWVMQAAAQLLFGVQDKSVPSAFSGIVRFSGVVISVERLAVTLAAAALIVALYAFLEYTRTGRAMRATAQDADAAALLGVNIEAVSALGFGVGCGLAGASGALLAPIFSVNPSMGTLPVVKAFIIIIIGGMGSLPGAVLGGLLLGALEGVGTLFFSSAAVNLLGFLMVITVLLLRPRGLLGGT